MDLEKYKINDGIYFPENFDPNDFNYSDGEDFEKELYNLIYCAQDKSLFSRELAKKIIDWPSFCHLSPVRTNLLRPISEILKGRILEMGAGCGIITRYLGEIGGQVVALEASLQRSKITKERTADLNNVTVVCDRIETFNTSNKFDIVTMIGVLQYSRLFSNFGGNAEINVLQAAIEQLDSDGVLIIAIQNKLGLKYFSGYPEANAGIPFFGIENRYHEKSIIRFDRQEIQLVLNSLGLKHQKFLYPFPDYHMPKTIFSEQGIKELNASSVSDMIIPCFHQEKIRPDWTTPHFMLESAWETICNAGLASNLANAFLIVASRTDKVINSLDENRKLVWHYSTDRPAEYAVEKEFQLNDMNEVAVKRNKVCEKKSSSVLILHDLSEELYVNGRMYWTHFIKIVKNENWKISQVAQWALKWMQFVCKEANIPDLYKINLNEQLVDGKLYDCTPFNCILDEQGNLNFIDKEWDFQFKIKLIVILLRGLFSSFMNITKISPSENPALSITDNIISLFNELHIQVTKEMINEAIAFDNICQRIVHGSVNMTNINQELVDTLFRLHCKEQECQVLNAEISTVKQNILALEQKNLALSNENASLTNQSFLLKNEVEELNQCHEMSITNWQVAYHQLLNSRSVRLVKYFKNILHIFKIKLHGRNRTV